MPENENPNAAPRTVSVTLTEGHIATLDAIARSEERSRSAQLRTLIDEEAGRRSAVLKTPAAAQAA